MNKDKLGFGELDLGKDWGISKLYIDVPNEIDIPHITIASTKNNNITNLCLEEAKFLDDNNLTREQIKIIDNYLSSKGFFDSPIWFDAMLMWKSEVENADLSKVSLKEKPNYGGII